MIHGLAEIQIPSHKSGFQMVTIGGSMLCTLAVLTMKPLGFLRQARLRVLSHAIGPLKILRPWGCPHAQESMYRVNGSKSSTFGGFLFETGREVALSLFCGGQGDTSRLPTPPLPSERPCRALQRVGGPSMGQGP